MYKSDIIAITVIIGIVILMMLFTIPIFLLLIKRETQFKYNYINIYLGMSEYEMLKIMGPGYNKSLLKNNRVKYEWRINGSSHGSSYGYGRYRSYHSTYTGVSKVDIYVKDGLVEEVKPFNC